MHFQMASNITPMTHHRLTFVPKRLAWRSAAGFTLVEMAVVITLMAIFATVGLRLLQATRDSAAWTETKAKQERIKLALVGYLRSNGTLPCPDATLVGTAPTGLKGTPPCLGALGSGVVPWKDLGLSVSDVQDGWSNFFTYRVANGTPATSSNWTIKVSAGGQTAFSITELTVPLVTFSLKERDAAGVLSATALSPNPVVVLVSHGKNGSGALTLGGTRLAAPPVGSDERFNADAGTEFISRAPTDVAAPTIGLFDDLVAYMTPQDLLQPLLTEGTLKACVAYCPPPPGGGTAVAGCVPATIPIGVTPLTCP